MARHLLASIIAMLFFGAPPAVRASCVGTPLAGLDPTGVADNTAAVQSAIDAAFKSGGGAVILNTGRYRMTGTLTVKRGVVLCGATHGPFDAGSVDPTITTIAATFLITNADRPFITLNGSGSAVTDLLFHYPNQALPTELEPFVYPFTISVLAAGTKVERCTVTNAYQFLDIQSGRTAVRDLFLGAFLSGIRIDHAADHVSLSNITQSVFWHLGQYASFPQPIDAWVLNNGYGFVLLRVDGVQIQDVLVFHKYAAFYLADSPDTGQVPKNGYGLVTNVDIDECRVGIMARATNFPGFKFSNIDIGCGLPTDPARSGVAYVAGGTAPPIVLLNGGSIRGTWTSGPFESFPPPAKLVVHHILGYDE